MKSPEIIYETSTVEVPTIVTVYKPVVVNEPKNCVHPVQATRAEVSSAAGMINYLRREYEFKYKACLESEVPAPDT